MSNPEPRPDNAQQDGPGEDDQAKPPEPEEAGEAKGAEGSPRPQADPDLGEDAIRSAQERYFSSQHAFEGSTTYIFNGSVHNDGTTSFGPAGEPRPRRRSTGRVPDHDIDEVLRWFVPPPAYDRAERILAQERLLIITGYEGAGKRTSALALLRGVGRRDDGYPEITSLSPASSLASMADVRYEKAHGYLVQDHIGERADAAVQLYDVEQLAEVLLKVDAHLVITTRATRMNSRDLARFVVRLDGPRPADLLVHRLREEDVDTGSRMQALEQVAALHRPRDVLAVAERVCGGAVLDASDVDEVAQSTVAEWFDTNPKARDVLYVAALAFVGRQPESLFEVRLENLCELAGMKPPESSTFPADTFVQRSREHTLITFERPGEGPDAAGEGYDDSDYYDGLGWSSGKTVRFRSSRYREYVLTELLHRYPLALWKPLRQWIGELPLTDPGATTQLQLAMGLAELAKHDFADVYESYLNRWAAGTATERATAALVLWFMADRGDGELAAVALQTALRWGNASGLNRAVTSAAALGGPLGLTFRPESLRRLCFLAFRARRIGVVARLSIAFLFATAVEAGPDTTADVLRTVVRHLRKAVATDKAGRETTDQDLYGGDDLYKNQDEARSRRQDEDDDEEIFEIGWNVRVARAARTLGVSLLAARGTTNEPLVARILKSQPENVALLGYIWAEALCSAPHRMDAIEALMEVLRAVEREPEARGAVADLGAAIFSDMPAAHRPLRAADLIRAVADERRGTRPAQVLVSSLLHAVRGR